MRMKEKKIGKGRAMKETLLIKISSINFDNERSCFCL